MQSHTTRPLSYEVQRILERLWGAWAWLVASLGFLVILPLTVWSFWRNPEPFIFKVAEVMFFLAWGWLLVSLLQMARISRELGLTGEGRLKVLSGPRPRDPDELRLWKSVWRFVIAFIATILAMIVFAVVGSLTGQ